MFKVKSAKNDSDLVLDLMTLRSQEHANPIHTHIPFNLVMLRGHLGHQMTIPMFDL